MEELDPNDEKAQEKAWAESQIELTAALQLLVEIRMHFVAEDILTKIDFADYSKRAEETIRRKLKERFGEGGNDSTHTV